MSPSARPGAVETLAAMAGASANPRRPPAHRSVSLLHPPRRRSSPNEASDSSRGSNSQPSTDGRKLSTNSPSSLQPLGRDSSGESSNAEKWFEKSNNEVQDNSISYVDNEPPFFMRNSSSSETPPDLRQTRLRQFLTARDEARSAAMRTGLHQLATESSSTEGFRGVIDDLTVENRKLKRRLKRYERLHDAHLKDEKLFEVRIHGLPPEKKRELENMLRTFTNGLANQPGDHFPRNGYQGLPPFLQTRKGTSSQASLQQTDSAYASMSASGQGGSSGLSGGVPAIEKPAPSAPSPRQSIQRYLHHIPEGLLPQPNPATMSERAKKKLVVKRLEQIFAGRGAAGGHHQPLQQQEVSQSAARADRFALEAQGQRTRQEGIREAAIMSGEFEEAKQESPDEDSVATKREPAVKVVGQDATEASPAEAILEQRPTRPLDLDPYRAQIPADNIAYFRHLGFSPPEPESVQPYDEGHGWIYLNLLINMAQLHTINVTVEFVRKALGDYGDRFELSSDGRKVRWRGRRHASGASGGASGDVSSDDPGDGHASRKRRKLSYRLQSRSHLHVPGPGLAHRSRQGNSKVGYTPMFSHRDSTEDSDVSSSAEDDGAFSSPFPPLAQGDSSGMTSSGVRTMSTRRQKPRDDGPIIFYNNTRFCTDLSAEHELGGNQHAPRYTKLAVPPIGHPPMQLSNAAERRGPLDSAAILPEPMELGDNPIPESLELIFPEESSLHSLSGAAEQPRPRKTINLEVTGIGGVRPADNFEVNVQCQLASFDRRAAPAVLDENGPPSLPSRVAHLLRESPAKNIPQVAISCHLISSTRRDLPPAELPPALSLMILTDDSHGDDESEAEDNMSSSSEPLDAEPLSPALQAIDMPSTDSYDEGEDDSDVESDSSLDFLAAARQVDPETIRAQEREYDAQIADRLAEEIPAGSSAATAGGGSGFASPASGFVDKDHQRTRRAAATKILSSSPSATRQTQIGDDTQVLGGQEDNTRRRQ